MCPLPVLLTKRRIQELKAGKVLEIVGDDPRARDNIERWAKDAGHEVLEVDDSKSDFIIKIRRS
jgi:TusA-related sulfurtransferase